jgi:hypothetical protein
MIRRVEGRPSPCGASPRRTNRDCESATSRLFLCVCVRAYVCDTVHDGTAYPSSAVRSQILHTALSPSLSFRNSPIVTPIRCKVHLLYNMNGPFDVGARHNSRSPRMSRERLLRREGSDRLAKKDPSLLAGVVAHQNQCCPTKNSFRRRLAGAGIPCFIYYFIVIIIC